MVFFFIIVSILDLIGLSLIGSYIAAFLGLKNPLIDKFSFLFSYFSEIEPIVILGIAIILLFIFKLVSALLSNYIIIIFSTRQMNNLRLKLLYGYQEESYLLQKQRKTSDYIYNIVNLTAEFSIVVQAFLRIASEFILLFLILFFLALQDLTTLSILAILIFSILIIYDKIFKKKLKKYGKEINLNNNSAINAIIEIMNGLKEIKILQKQNYFFLKTKDFLSKMLRAKEKATIIQLSPRYVMEFVLVFFVITLTLISIVKGNNNVDLLPKLGVFAFAAIRILPSSSVILSSNNMIRTYMHAVDLLHTDLEKINTINKKDDENTYEKKEEVDFKSLKLKNLSFKFPNTQKYIFKNLNLTINKGDAIGIMGKSGSGKSTLLNILMGFIKFSEGRIVYNEKFDHNKCSYLFKDKCFFLPQQPFLVSGSFKDNILLGEKFNENTETQLIYATKGAEIFDFIEQKENYFDEKISERGSNLSDGQKQRIGFARTFFYNKEIIIFDEATNALDQKTEKIIIEKLSKLKKIKTIIFVSHKRQNLDFCDKIYQLDQASFSILK
mgnify:CR=1 FL=1